jgi:hypothetical protein
VALWGDCVSSFFSQKQTHATGGKILVHLSAVSSGKLRKDSWNGECLSNIRVLSTVEARGASPATRITFPKAASSPYIGHLQFQLPGCDSCIASFVGFKAKFKPPFRGTFVGTVTNAQDTAQSARGNPKKFFDLVDSSGHWFSCCALGRNAASKALVDGAVVICFYGTGRSALGDSPAAVYLLDDAVVVQVGRAETSVVRRAQLELT